MNIRIRAALLFAAAAALHAETYIVGLLETPESRPSLTKEAAAQLQAAHMKHIGDMAASGALVGAGPVYETKGRLRGLFIFAKTSLERARELAQADPKVKAGDLVVRLIEWEGPPGIGERYRREHQDPSARTTMLRLQLGLVRKGPIPTDGVAAGPVKSPDYVGMFVMNRGSLDAARQAAANPDIDWHGWMVADGVLP